MKKYWYILICCIFSVVSGCTSKEGEIYSKYFINGYIHPYAFHIIYSGDGMLIGDFTQPMDYSGVYNWADAYIWADFDTYSNRYGDVNFNRGKPGPFLAIAEPMDKISIISDKDYDTEHPAGTPLDDIVNLVAESAYRFIVVDHYKGHYGFDAICKPLSQLTKEDMTLLNKNQFRFEFPEQGRPVGETHTLTITITYMGEEIIATAEHTF